MINHLVFKTHEGSKQPFVALFYGVHIFHSAGGMVIPGHPQSDAPATLSFRV
jgi:hypothetical protein